MEPRAPQTQPANKPGSGDGGRLAIVASPRWAWNINEGQTRVCVDLHPVPECVPARVDHSVHTPICHPLIYTLYNLENGDTHHAAKADRNPECPILSTLLRCVESHAIGTNCHSAWSAFP